MSDTATSTDAAAAATTDAAAAGTTGTDQAAATTTQATDAAAQTATAAAKVEDLPDWAQKRIADLTKEAGDSRINAKKTAAEEARQELAQQLAAILDPSKAEQKVDPAQLTQQLTATQADARAAALELAIYKAANAAGAKPDALTDSRTFMTKVAGIDPTDSTALAAAIGEAISTNPLLKAAPGASAVGGVEIAGGAGQTRTYTRSQIADPAFFQANKADILAAISDGRILQE